MVRVRGTHPTVTAAPSQESEAGPTPPRKHDRDARTDHRQNKVHEADPTPEEKYDCDAGKHPHGASSLRSVRRHRRVRRAHADNPIARFARTKPNEPPRTTSPTPNEPLRTTSPTPNELLRAVDVALPARSARTRRGGRNARRSLPAGVADPERRPRRTQQVLERHTRQRRCARMVRVRGTHPTVTAAPSQESEAGPTPPRKHDRDARTDHRQNKVHEADPTPEEKYDCDAGKHPHGASSLRSVRRHRRVRRAHADNPIARFARTKPNEPPRTTSPTPNELLRAVDVALPARSARTRRGGWNARRSLPAGVADPERRPRRTQQVLERHIRQRRCARMVRVRGTHPTVTAAPSQESQAGPTPPRKHDRDARTDHRQNKVHEADPTPEEKYDCDAGKHPHGASSLRSVRRHRRVRRAHADNPIARFARTTPNEPLRTTSPTPNEPLRTTSPTTNELLRAVDVALPARSARTRRGGRNARRSLPAGVADPERRPRRTQQVLERHTRQRRCARMVRVRGTHPTVTAAPYQIGGAAHRIVRVRGTLPARARHTFSAAVE